MLEANVFVLAPGWDVNDVVEMLSMKGVMTGMSLLFRQSKMSILSMSFFRPRSSSSMLNSSNMRVIRSTS